MPYRQVNSEHILRLQAPADGFLCPLSANNVGVEFLSFDIRDYDSKRTIFSISKEDPQGANQNQYDDAMDLSGLNETATRQIQYSFSVDVLRTPTISTSLTFAVGDCEVEDFRMIERHYFKDTLIKSFDFTFGFCIPASTNTWEAIYAVPLLDDELVDEMVACPYETRSDSFYFVNDVLIMHNKAEYSYSLQGAQSKRGPGRVAKSKNSAPRSSAKSSSRNIQFQSESKQGSKSAY